MEPQAVLPALVIGAGHAGLSASYHLQRRGIAHEVIEGGRVGEAWRSARWNSFCLNTPNWSLRLPGFPYEGDAPDAFLSRDAIVRHLEAYRARYDLPVRERTRVTGLARGGASGPFRIDTSDGARWARNVIVSTGAFHAPKPPPGADRFPAAVKQVPWNAYRDPGSLPAGAILVVGTGQSGAQITEELVEAGRRVYLSAGKCPRVPRRYRGKDIVFWLENAGFFSRTVDALPSPAAKLACNPITTGTRGGHDIDLRALAQDGVTLLGRFEGVAEGRARFAADLHETLVKADQFFEQVMTDTDAYIAKQGIAAPVEAHPPPLPPVPAEITPIRELDLAREGITTVLWATGGRPDFSWIRSPAVDERGEVAHARGITADPGLCFVGLHWQHRAKSDLFLGVGEDADHVVTHVASRLGA